MNVSHLTDPVITCPNCERDIKLTESLAAPLLAATRQEFEKKLSEKEGEFSKKEKALRDQQEELDKAKENIDQQVSLKLKQEREGIAEAEKKKARELFSNEIESKAKELNELQEVLKNRDEKLAEAQKAQAEFSRKQRELDDAKREMDLTIEKRVEESLATVKNKAKQEAEEALKLKVSEKEQTIVAMQKQIEELRRKAEQGSQQLQGEVQELELEDSLRLKFPYDSIEPVPKGEHGGDALHRVYNSAQQFCGTIIWESKRTKNWSDTWLPKLREDQRSAKAELAVMVSQTLPKDVDTFDLVDGVWVTSPKNVIPVAIALRQTLLELTLVRQASEGQQTKMEMVYAYLTGPNFRHRVQAIVEKFSEMMEDLEKERKVMTKLWSKREMQLRTAIESTAGMYGDLQGIAGKTLKEIEGLDVELLEEEGD